MSQGKNGMNEEALQDAEVTSTTATATEEEAGEVLFDFDILDIINATPLEPEGPRFTIEPPQNHNPVDPWIQVLDVLPDGRPFVYWTKRNHLETVREWNASYNEQQRNYYGAFSQN